MKLVTHNGRFHYDEILATAILKLIFPEHEIIRTRDKQIIDQGDIVYDVGGIFDPKTNRYDHHQHTFTETYSEKYPYKLSSSGLIYKFYNKEFFALYGISHKDPLFNDFRDKIYEDFFLGADCADNGVEYYTNIKPRTIYNMVDLYNNSDDVMSSKQNEQFFKALELVSNDLKMYIDDQIKSWWNKFKELEPKITNLEDYILVDDNYYTCDLILDVEKKCNKNILFLIYPSDGKYKIRAIDKFKGKFESKLPLKTEWRGKRDEELRQICPGAVFVHNSGFIGINDTLEGAIKMCRDTYENQ